MNVDKRRRSFTAFRMTRLFRMTVPSATNDIMGRWRKRRSFTAFRMTRGAANDRHSLKEKRWRFGCTQEKHGWVRGYSEGIGGDPF
jgi:hypothetical protein